MSRTRNYDYEAELEIFPGGYGPNKYEASFCINYDVEPAYAGSFYDPPHGGGVTVNSVSILVNGEKVDCPSWLEQLVLDAIDDDRLMEHAAQLEEVI